MRLRLARALGTHKSFLSQITNPDDPTPIPVRHLPQLFDLCHFTRDEQNFFMSAYKAAHPRHAGAMAARTATRAGRTKTLKIEIPVVDDPARQRAIEAFVQEFAKKLTGLL
ncbi:hypothetical protein [Inquilinus limosus]|uniref:Uncharacterized protein n=1 Tax=Inquilinus limosus TaxID=171674 RepID=A0A211ZEX3_9PROT|nr:hypothetical protein [Inquilinus limosus]OWJ63736.1 hypothetical protein BWR60_28240 [Inquilinus limosus]